MNTPAKGRLKSRDTGKRGEREIVSVARQHGFEARRTWQTAQASDPVIRHCDGRPVQVKVARRGFQPLSAALDDVVFAFVLRDRAPWLAVVPVETLLELLRYKPEPEVLP